MYLGDRNNKKLDFDVNIITIALDISGNNVLLC